MYTIYFATGALFAAGHLHLRDKKSNPTMALGLLIKTKYNWFCSPFRIEL